MIYKIGVTGNICSGKSSCINFLSKLPHSYGINLDICSHVVYERNEIFNNLIRRLFLSDAYDKYGTIYETFHRKKLGNTVFHDMNKLNTLNRLIRPEIKRIFEMELNCIKENNKGSIIVFVEGALIIEAGFHNYFDEIWMTTANKEEIKKRYKQRNGEDLYLLEKILACQMDERVKANFCSQVIDTSGPKEETQREYQELHKSVLRNKLHLYSS